MDAADKVIWPKGTHERVTQAVIDKWQATGVYEMIARDYVGTALEALAPDFERLEGEVALLGDLVDEASVALITGNCPNIPLCERIAAAREERLSAAEQERSSHDR